MNNIYELKLDENGTDPVTLTQAKTFLRVTSTDDDDTITELISIARKKIERYTCRSLMDFDVILTAYLDSPILLPYPKFGTLTSVKILQGQLSDGTNDWDTLTATDYQLIGTDSVTFCPAAHGVYEITYTTVATSLDAALSYDLKRVLLWLYENRGDDSDNMPVELMSNAKHLRILSYV
jgi:uncharacterized phiE125 gp8 family phage protein